MSSDFIHDPDGIVLFNRPTQVEVTSGIASSTALVRVLPFSARRGETTFWAGKDTYEVPPDAEYSIIEDLSPLDQECTTLPEQ
jgi:hypothetical protein